MATSKIYRVTFTFVADHYEDGNLSPADFIHLADDCFLIDIEEEELELVSKGGEKNA